MRYLFLLLALPILLGASAGPQVFDDLGQLRFVGGPWVSADESDESDVWPAWDNQVRNPALVTDFSTASWPRNYGRICVTFTAGPSGEHRAIIDGRTGPDDPRPYLAVVNDGRIRFGIQTVGSIAGGTVIPGQTHIACVDRSYGPTTSLYLDDQLIGTSATLPAWDWHETVRLGSRYGGADPLGGEIKFIQWRGFRLVCDMRSDTCSDGRRITTERATPVPCEVSPGVWEMVPEDTGCYSVRGLESWNESTSYLSYGAELDRSPWEVESNNTLTPLPGGGYRLCHQEGADENSGIKQYTGLEPQGSFTISAVVRSNTATQALLRVGSRGVLRTLSMDWDRISYASGLDLAQESTFYLYPRPSGAGQCVDIIGFWFNLGTSTPRRPCWGGEAPVTCAGDRHLISTEGWPTENGEVCLTVNLNPQKTVHMIFDGRSESNSQGPFLSINLTDRFNWTSGDTTLNSLVVSRGDRYRICVGRREGKLTMSVNGVSMPPIDGPALAWESIAILGDSFDATQRHINSSISSLRVRSFE